MDIEGQRSKEDQPSVGFPDICFAIEDFDVAFKGLVSIDHHSLTNLASGIIPPGQSYQLPTMTALPVKQYSAPATCTILLSTWCRPSCIFGRDDSVHCILWGFMMLGGFSAEPSVCWAADRVRAWLVLCGDAVSHRRPSHCSPAASPTAPAARSCQPATRRGICSCSAERHSLSCHSGAVPQQQRRFRRSASCTPCRLSRQ